MTESSNFQPSRRRIPFTIDGQPFTTDDLSQRSSALLRLGRLEPCHLRPGGAGGKGAPPDETLRR